MKQESEEAAGLMKPENKFLFEDEEQTMEFSPAAPVVSFRKMVGYNKEDLVLKALDQMSNYVSNKLAFSVTEAAYRHLAECAGEMRLACVSQQEENYWDKWFKGVGGSAPGFYSFLKSEGVGLIRGDNLEVFKV